MEEKPAVACSEKSCKSEFNTEMIFSCAVRSANALLNESSKSETDVHPLHTELDKNSESQSCALSSLAQNDLDECTIIIDDSTSTIESVTDISNLDPEDITSSFEIHSNIESTSQNLINHSMTNVNNTMVYFEGKTLESSERCNISLEQDKQDLAVDNNSESKCLDSEQQTEKKLIVSESVEKSIQDNITDIKSEPADLTLAVSQATEEKQAEGPNLPKYILVKRKTLQTQNASIKPGSKLTSLLQRLTAEKGYVTMPDNSILCPSRMLPKSLLSQKEADPVISHSHSLELSSLSGISAESPNTEQTLPQHSFRNAPSSATNVAPVPFIQIQHDAVTRKARLTVKLSQETDSLTSKRHKNKASNSSKAETSEFKLLQKDNVPIKIIKSNESLQSELKNINNEHINLPLQQNKLSEVSLKTGAHVLTDCGKIIEPKKHTKSADPTSHESLGHQTLIYTDKGKYVLDHASWKMLAQSSRSKVHSPFLQGAIEPDPKLSNVQTKPKHQFSLLKLASAKHSRSSNTSTCDISKVPTIYSLLSNSSATPFISLKPPDNSTSDVSQIKNTTPILVSPVAVRDLTKTAFVPGLGPNSLILAQNSNSGQIFFHSLPNQAVRSSNSQSSGISASALSNLTTPTSKKYNVKTCIKAPSSSLFTSIPQTVVAVPTSAIQTTPKTTILTISSQAHSSSNIHDGISSISSATPKVKSVKTMYSTAIPRVSQKNQQLTGIHQNYSTFITKFALKSLSQTSASRPAEDLQSSLIPGSLQTEDSLSAKEILSDMSFFKISSAEILTVPEILQALEALKSSTATSKTTHTSVTIPATESSNVCTSVPSCQEPVKVTASSPGNVPSIRLIPENLKLILPAIKKRPISLLNVPSTPEILYSTSASPDSETSIANVTVPNVEKKLKSKAEKSIKSKILEQNTLELSSTSCVLNPNLRNISVEMNTRTPRKAKKDAVYSTTLEQDPISVMVVAPDIEDDSSDTMSETNTSNLRSPVKLKLDKKVGGFDNSHKLAGIRCPEKSETLSNRNDNLPDKGLEAGMVEFSSCEELETSNQSGQFRFPIVVDDDSDTLSDTEFSHSRCFKETESSNQGSQHIENLDDEETDSDLEVGNSEEQDMSVLRQLLKGKDCTDLHVLSSRHLQTEPDTAHDVINRQFNLVSIHKPHLTSSSENKLPSKTGSIQQVPLSPFIQNGVLDQTVKQHPSESDSCGLKIESIFSLSNNAELEEPEFTMASNLKKNYPTIPDDQSLVFNVRDSEDWKNFVNPCFVVLERLPKAQVIAKGSSQIQSKCSEHCRKRTLDYLCKLNLLKCVNHPEATSFLKPIRRTAMKKSLTKNVQYEIVRQEMPVNESGSYSKYPPLFSDLKQNHESELYSQYPPLFSDLKRKLQYEPHNKSPIDVSSLSPIIQDAKQTSGFSKTDHFEMEKSLFSEHDGKKTDIAPSPSLDEFTSSRDLKKFHSGLKQLQKQVNRKRAKMLSQKFNIANLKLQTKSKIKANKNRSHTLPLTTNLDVSTKIMKYTPVNRTIPAKQVVLEKMSSAENNTSHLANVAQRISSKKKGRPSEVIPSAVKKFSACKSGISLVPAKTTRVSKIPLPKLKSGVLNVVSIQPKMQPFPVEKVKAALQSLNSYLESTGRKPTNDDTQYILLKIDDQHILVKLPFTNVSAEQLNNITVPATTYINHAPPGGVAGLADQQMQSGTDTNMVKSVSNAFSANNAFSVINNTTAAVSNVNPAATANTNSALKTPKIASNTASSSIIRTSSSTSSLVSSVPKKSIPAKPKLSVLKSTTTTDSPDKIEKTAKLPRSFFIPHQNHDQNNSSKEKSAVNTPQNISHSYVTNSVKAHPAMISLLAPVTPSYSQSKMAVINPVCQMRNVGANAPSPVPLTISFREIPSSSLKTANEEPNTMLSNLTFNSSMLPQCKRKAVTLSEEAKEHKRRRLEAKYPLPPGIVIKSEPDDLDYELSAQWTDAPGTLDDGNFPVTLTEDTLIKKPPEMYSPDQAWVVVNSNKTGSSLPLTNGHGLETQNMHVRNVLAYSSSNMKEMLSEEQFENKEDSSDEPPALIEEAISDEECHQKHGVIGTQEDMPPVLQPMFTSSSLSFVEDTDIMEMENTCLTKEVSVYKNTISSRETKQPTSPKKDSNKATGSTSGTSLYSENSVDSGIGSNNPSKSSSYTSVKHMSTPPTEKSICNNLKIQHLKELLKKKEMEIENMKKLQSEFPSLDLDYI